MNTIENNKLIAEFMGYDRGVSDLMDYNTSWDWLMPVVEKIESLDLELLKRNIKYNLDKGINFQNCNSIIIRWDKNNKIVFISSDRNRVYKAVVEFIKWYNEVS